MKAHSLPAMQARRCSMSFLRTIRNLRPGEDCGSPWPRPKRRWGYQYHRRADRRAGGQQATTSTTTWPASGKSWCRHDVMSHVYAYGVPVPEGQRHHPPGRHQLLCRRQHRYHHHARGRWRLSAASCINVIGHAGQISHDQYKDMPCLGLHPSAAGPADHRRQARHSVD